jgi:hypothetical protein
VTFISRHSVIIYVVFFGACMRCTRLCPLKPGVTVAEEQHPGLSRHLPRHKRRRQGNRGQAGGGISSAVERFDDTGTPAGDMSGVVLAPETTTSVISPQHANPKRTDDASTLAEELLGVSLVPKMMVQSVPTRPRHRPSIKRYCLFSTLCLLDSASIRQATPLR